MTVRIDPLIGTQLSNLITFFDPSTLNTKQIEMIEWCQSMSGEMWTGWADGDLVAVWGLIPPTLLSNQAYLWMHATDAVKDHTFLFVRHSQRMVERMLKHYETIVGHCVISSKDSIRWVKWLGGEFGDYDGQLVPFTIRRKHG
jgi:hypothetical protein